MESHFVTEKHWLQIQNAVIHGLDKPGTIIYSPAWVCRIKTWTSVSLYGRRFSNVIAFRADEYEAPTCWEAILRDFLCDCSVWTLISPSFSFVKMWHLHFISLFSTDPPVLNFLTVIWIAELVTRHPAFNVIIPFLSVVFSCPNKDETGHQIVPLLFNNAILFRGYTKLYVTRPVHIWYWVFVICMRTALWRSDYTVSCGDVWLLQECERFDICTVGKRKPVKMLKR